MEVSLVTSGERQDSYGTFRPERKQRFYVAQRSGAKEAVLRPSSGLSFRDRSERELVTVRVQDSRMGKSMDPVEPEVNWGQPTGYQKKIWLEHP